MRSFKRFPEFFVRIVRPNYSAKEYKEALVGVFVPKTNPSDGESNDLLSYSYAESLRNPVGTFSLTLAPVYDRNNKTWVDKLSPRDIVIISELGAVRFVGYIESIRYSARIDSAGSVERSILVSGKSISGLLSQMKVVLDKKLLPMQGDTAKTANEKLMHSLSQKMDKGMPLRGVIKDILNNFFEIIKATAIELSAGYGILNVLNYYVDFDSEISTDVRFLYPMAFQIYLDGEQDLLSILNGIIAAPLHELFFRWNREKQKIALVIRDTPFDPQNWINLTLHSVDPLVLTSFDVGKNDNEVRTYFGALVSGSGISLEMALVSPNIRQAFTVLEDKWNKYGYRPFFVDFKYFDKEKIREHVADLMLDYSKKVKNWFGKMDEFYSGTIKLVTVDEKQNGLTYPRIGERVSFLGGEFYIEGTQRSWSYGQNMQTVLQVTRGYEYKNGHLWGEIKSIGQRIASVLEIER